MAELDRERLYTFSEALQLAEVDLNEVAAVDYNPDGVDLRRVKVGGLGFDTPDATFHVGHAESVEVTVDGEVVATLEVAPEADEA